MNFLYLHTFEKCLFVIYAFVMRINIAKMKYYRD